MDSGKVARVEQRWDFSTFFYLRDVLMRREISCVAMLEMLLSGEASDVSL